MELRKKSPGGRLKKTVARREFGAGQPVFFRWVHGTGPQTMNPEGYYEFCIELTNSATGETYELAGKQVELMDLFQHYQARFAEATA